MQRCLYGSLTHPEGQKLKTLKNAGNGRSRPSRGANNASMRATSAITTSSNWRNGAPSGKAQRIARRLLCAGIFNDASAKRQTSRSANVPFVRSNCVRPVAPKVNAEEHIYLLSSASGKWKRIVCFGVGCEEQAASRRRIKSCIAHAALNYCTNAWKIILPLCQRLLSPQKVSWVCRQLFWQIRWKNWVLWV